MMVLLYAIAERNTSISGDGLDGRPLRTVDDGEIAAVVSDCDRTPPPTEENLWAYEEIVEGLMACTPLLPARFGATAAQDEEIKIMLASRHEEFRRMLERVRGAVEIAIRLPHDVARIGSAGVTDEASGTDYMLARLAQRQRARQLAAKVDGAVQSLARERTQRTNSGNTLAYLVDQEQIDEFIERLDQLGDPDVSWTGPWPPYSFTQPAGETP